MLAAALAGCTASSSVAPDATDPSDTPAPPVSPAPSPSPPPSGVALYPQGASADTPECQEASAAVVAAVNATFDDQTPRAASGIDRLVASPDTDHAVWILTGVVPSTSSAGGYVVVWATTGDPTDETFDGNLRSIGSSTATVSTAPSLQFADVDAPFELPEAALRCAPVLSGYSRG